MSALELTGTYPPVSSEDDAAEAVQLLFEHKLPALLVVDRDGQPYAIVPGSQPMERLVPEYALGDPILVAVIDDRHLNKVPGGLPGARWPSGSLAEGSVRPRPVRTRASYTSRPSSPVRTLCRSPSSNATAATPGRRAPSRPPA